MTIFKAIRRGANRRTINPPFPALLAGMGLFILTLFSISRAVNSPMAEAANEPARYATLAEASAAVRKMTASSQAGCNSYEEQQKLVSPETLTGTNFGDSVAISGNTAVIGAPWDVINGNNRQGSAFVFVRTGTTWSFQQKLTASDGGFDDRFGQSLALSGDTILIGAPLHDVGSNANQGAAYVFFRNGATWGLQQKLLLAGGGFLDNFGTNVALDGDTAAITSSRTQPNQQGGGVHVFFRIGTGWGPQQSLLTSDGVNASAFGSSLAISGETILVGAPLTVIDATINRGVAYAFVRNGVTWSQQQRLAPAIPLESGSFGQSVALQGNSAVIGVPGEAIGSNSGQGAAYIFTRTGTTWTQQQKLIAADGQAGERFGVSVGISQDTALIASSGNSQPFMGETAAYVFRRTGTTWSLLQQLMTSEGKGASLVSVSSTTALVNTFVFECSPCPAFVFQPGVLSFGRVGRSFSTTFSVTGGAAPYTYDLFSGDLPQGLTLSPGGVLSGTPTTEGENYFVLRATDSSGCTGRRLFRLVVYAACGTITITPASLPAGYVDAQYGVSLMAQGGRGNYTYVVSSGSLPPGIILGSSGGLGGIPTTAGTYTFSVQATDGIQCTGAPQAYTLIINPPCPSIAVSPASIPGATVGIAYNVTFSQSGGTAPITWSAPFGGLPSGLSLDPSTGVLSGTPQLALVADFTIRATDANGCTGERVYNLLVMSSGLQYYPLPRPIRLFDTRAPIPGFPSCAYLSSPLPGGSTITRQTRISCDGITIPSTAQAVVGNATVINPAGNGFISIWPNGQSRPPVSTLNYLTGQVIANAFTTALGSDGQITIYSEANTDFAMDITGYFAPPGTGGLYFHRLPRPIRLLDSRAPIPGFPACANLSAPLTADAEISRQARITCDGVTIPSDAQAIVGNATVVTPSAGGFLTLWPNGQSRPSVSNLNFAAGQVVPNAFTVGLGSDGQFRVYTSAGTHLVLDVAGYYSASPTDSQGNNGSLFIPLIRPIRVFDTRAPIPGFPACAYLNAPIAANSELSRSVTINCDGVTIPSTTQAIVGNATIVSPAAGGYATIYPFGQSRPIASNLNFVAGQTVANAFTAGVISGGQITIFSSAGTHFIVDLTGYFSQ